MTLAFPERTDDRGQLPVKSSLDQWVTVSVSVKETATSLHNI